ncbi:MAG: release factor glutamine methyltransferase [Halanaerobium sp. 4-GBenrich]|jgi:release factor glutamine methyltransferase|uniref:Release factor glutamine methyltransferase n=1 Tax=Halanaerobium congolense TaxID=54121 RepID=A0A1G6J2H0_9FIRM|nr:peptide chain release factor N(5)-glutamine methyltransferase [Halanaerobium congolense]KXS48685.1 MAG: release factor glutamine methyltransferase [Halanaerobium sp. T82-1]ODS49977.1 MAG: release factor glutamine methyltransferase [Halanaerobium sp. 4-GBenrich]PUU91739.1 MAG: release factor glutamine methyltransferase [Halanaerobium sp.]PTX15826.1 release factor glutamine methyltransferase [Halanaerobium congolense]TDS33959.1 release factor glutamine methyltransferase [Halanaerobium congole
MNIKELLNRSDQFLAARGIESSRLDAEVLMADLLDMERINLYVKYDYPLKNVEIDNYRERIKKRAQRIPVAYITEKKEFMSLEFKVKEGVLIPRPDTENLVEAVIEYCRKEELQSPQIIDVGTGSGAIAVSLAHYLEDAKVVGVDLSTEAIKVARQNMDEHELSERMSILKSDLLKEFIKREITGIDIIVSNPPYISKSEMEKLPPEVKKEPKTALAAGEDGLAYYKKLIPQAEKVLKNGGKLFLEIGYQQAEAVKALFGSSWVEVEVKKDYSENDRIAAAQFKKE